VRAGAFVAAASSRSIWRQDAAATNHPYRGKSFSRPTMPVIFGFFGTWDLMIIAFIAMLLFGNRLPSMMRSLGQGVQEFKKGVAGIEEEHHDDDPAKLDDKRKPPNFAN
jgi:sec-independent protein translocase protein TatA